MLQITTNHHHNSFCIFYYRFYTTRCFTLIYLYKCIITINMDKIQFCCFIDFIHDLCFRKLPSTIQSLIISAIKCDYHVKLVGSEDTNLNWAKNKQHKARKVLIDIFFTWIKGFAKFQDRNLMNQKSKQSSFTCDGIMSWQNLWQNLWKIVKDEITEESHHF